MLKDLQVRHRDIARLHFAGFSNKEISVRLNMSQAAISGILNDQLCQAYIAKLQDIADTDVISVRKRMLDMNDLALDRIEDILSPHSTNIPHSVVLAAAKDNLDRTGHQVVQKQINISAHLTKEDLAIIKERAINAGAAIPDAEYTECN